MTDRTQQSKYARTRLLLVLPHLGGGGAERVGALLACHLDPERFDLHLAVMLEDGPGALRLPPHVQVYRLGLRRVRQAAWPLIRLVRTIRPDSVLSGMAHLNLLILLLRPFLPRSVRIVVRQNTTASANIRTRFGRRLFALVYSRADAVICQTEAMADDLATHFRLSHRTLHVLSNPIDIAAIRSHQASEFVSQGAASPRLLAVGRMAREKGFDLLLQAMVEVRKAFPKAELVVLGVGPDRAGLLALRDALGLSDRVSFPGFADPSDYYAGSSLFVLSSRWEGMPNALLEAAAAGLPLVATPCCGGVVALLRDAPGAYVATGISAAALAEAILTAIQVSRDDEIPDETSGVRGRSRRFEHAFLAPYELSASIAAYEAVLLRTDLAYVGAADLAGASSTKARHESAKLHVALLLPTIDQIGGAERQVLLLARTFASRGWRVSLVCLSGMAAPPFPTPGVTCVSLHMRKAWIDPRGWAAYLHWFRANRPDILHCHLPHATWFARAVRCIAPVRVLIDTIHTSHIGSRACRFAYRLSHVMTTRTTCVSEAVAEAALAASTARRDKLSVIANGVEFRAQPRAEDAAECSDRLAAFQWLAIGRLARVKDYPTLLRAFAMLPRSSRLAIAGTGPCELPCRLLSQQLGISSRVDFLGFQTDTASLLRRADAFVLSSLWEGLPMSTLEAAADGLPIVATDAAGTRETMIPEVTGYLAPAGDAAALAAAMARMMALTAEERRAMGERGRQLVAERFDIKIVVDTWDQLYRNLLQSHPDRRRFG